MNEVEEQRKFKYISRNVIKDTLLILKRRDLKEKNIVINDKRNNVKETKDLKLVALYIKNKNVRYINITGKYKDSTIVIVADFVSESIYLTSEEDTIVIPFIDSVAV